MRDFRDRPPKHRPRFLECPPGHEPDVHHGMRAFRVAVHKRKQPEQRRILNPPRRAVEQDFAMQIIINLHAGKKRRQHQNHAETDEQRRQTPVRQPALECGGAAREKGQSHEDTFLISRQDAKACISGILASLRLGARNSKILFNHLELIHKEEIVGGADLPVCRKTGKNACSTAPPLSASGI